MNDRNVFEWLWLVNCVGCGNSRIWKILADFDTISEAYEVLNDKEKRLKYFNQNECRNADRTTEAQLNELISYCSQNGIYMLTFDDEKYPRRLKNIFNPPVLLFCRGDIGCLENEYSISVVGTRNPSEYSVKVTSAIVESLCKAGMTIVSGFAVGIDISAALSAVRCGGKTIAVLGCGLDYDYPKDNVCYREEIEKNGLFISEYFPKAGGTRFSFPARNRILSGLSLGTIVVEAAEKSGAMITANLALGQGKDIFVVAPHDIFDARYGGNMSLVRDGAVCICGATEILDEYYENKGHKIANKYLPDVIVLPEDGDLSEKSGNSSPPKKKEIAENKKPSYDTSGLSDEEKQVYNALKDAGRHVTSDELAELCGMDISEVLMILIDLEIEGAVEPAAGNSYIAR